MKPAAFITRATSTPQNWWHSHPLFQLDAGKAVPRPGKELEFDACWKSRNRDAWIYELARRLPTLLGQMGRSESTKTQPPPPPEDLALLKHAKPYDKLDLREQTILHMILRAQKWPRSIQVTEDDIASRLGHYSEPVPPWRFDLFASKQTVQKFVADWFKEQQKLAGFGFESKGEKGSASRNADQIYEEVRWDHLDYIENPRLLSSKAKSAHTNRKKRLYEYVMRDLRRIVAAVRWMHHDRKQPILPSEIPRVPV